MCLDQYFHFSAHWTKAKRTQCNVFEKLVLQLLFKTYTADIKKLTPWRNLPKKIKSLNSFNKCIQRNAFCVLLYLSMKLLLWIELIIQSMSSNSLVVKSYLNTYPILTHLCSYGNIIQRQLQDCASSPGFLKVSRSARLDIGRFFTHFQSFLLTIFSPTSCSSFKKVPTV